MVATAADVAAREGVLLETITAVERAPDDHDAFDVVVVRDASVSRRDKAIMVSRRSAPGAAARWTMSRQMALRRKESSLPREASLRCE
jgi:hypothetical protein